MRKFTERYFWVLFCVALLVAVDQMVVQPQLARLDSFAPVINVAGRQRMLSQKLTKSALAIQTADDTTDQRQHGRELGETLDAWSAAHVALVHGDPGRQLPETTNETILAAFENLEPHFAAMRAAALRIQSAMTLPDGQPAEAFAAQLTTDVATIQRHEAAFLTTMDQIVDMFEDAAGRHIFWLRMLGLAILATILGLLCGLGWFVLRPAARLIQAQVTRLAQRERRLCNARDLLEQRVAERTLQLETANAGLQHEMEIRRHAEEKTQQLSLQLYHASRVTAVGQLSASLAHEINQPLGAITNYAEVADLQLSLPQPDTGQARDTIDHIKRAAVRTGRLVRSLRTFVRPTAGQQSEFDLAELIDEVVALCRLELARCHVTLHTEIADDLPTITGDPIQVQQILVNLIQNATQAMQTSAHEIGAIWIEVCPAEDPRHISIEVRDDGPGFPVDDIESAFQPFYTTKPDGLGMGLAICRAIVGQHGGQLRAGNQVAGGACVHFTLPVTSLAPHVQAEPDRICR